MCGLSAFEDVRLYNASMFTPRRRGIPWPAYIMAAIILLGLASLYLAAPRLVSFFPQTDDGEVPASTPVRLTFSEPMNQRSVEVRFHVDPPMEGEFIWEGNSVEFFPSEPWPYHSSIEVRLDGGARSSRFLPLLGSSQWTFSTGTARVVYLWPEGGPTDIYARRMDEFEVDRLTTTPLGVMDYAIAPDGFTLVYAALRRDGGSDLRRLNSLTGEDELLYACDEAERCQNVAVSSSNIVLFDRIAYVASASGRPAQAESRVWALRLDSPADAYPIGTEGHDTTQGNPSQAGWAAFYDGTLRAITIVESIDIAEPDVLNQIPNDLGLLGSWSPDGLLLLYPAISFIQEGEVEPGAPLFYSHIYQTALPAGPSVDLSARIDISVEDSSPVTSPDGVWIAFTRKYLQAETWTLGRQLWLMRSDGSNQRQMTDEPAYTCSSPVWRFDSSALVYVRVNEGDYSRPSEIWWLDLDSGEPLQLVIGGVQPAWLP